MGVLDVVHEAANEVGGASMQDAGFPRLSATQLSDGRCALTVDFLDTPPWRVPGR